MRTSRVAISGLVRFFSIRLNLLRKDGFVVKKFILVLFVCVMLIGCFVSCDPIDKESVELSREGKDQDIVIGLSHYLSRLDASINPGDGRLVRKIDGVKNESRQALHVAFDPKDYYFVCAYHNPDHEHDEKYSCCNEYNYTWVKFFDKEDITELYNGLQLVASFQINKAKFVKDIVSKRADTPEFEHFLVYTPEFENGLNVADAVHYDETYLYFRSYEVEKGDYIIDSTDEWFDYLHATPCVKYKGKYYIKLVTKIGYQPQKKFEFEFGEYHDELMDIMITDKYTEEIEGKTYYYGLININKFVKKILK